MLSSHGVDTVSAIKLPAVYSTLKKITINKLKVLEIGTFYTTQFSATGTHKKPAPYIELKKQGK